MVFNKIARDGPKWTKSYSCLLICWRNELMFLTILEWIYLQFIFLQFYESFVNIKVLAVGKVTFIICMVSSLRKHFRRWLHRYLTTSCWMFQRLFCVSWDSLIELVKFTLCNRRFFFCGGTIVILRLYFVPIMIITWL